MRLIPSLIVLLPLALAGCIDPQKPRLPSGAEDFATFCAACHGSGAKGDGPAAALGKHPANLTALSRQNAGTFPATRVMAKIWGNSGAKDSHAGMPEFASLLDSDLVAFDGGDGRQTPTPLRLVQISNYLESLQK